MKKYNLLKVIAITIVFAWLLTLCIPGSYLDYKGVTTGEIASTGIWGLFSNLNISISYFNGIAVFLIAIACFYAVLSKIKPYQRFVDKVAKMFENRQKVLLIIVILFFGVLSLFVNDFTILLIFAPFVYQVMSKLEIDKKVILASMLVSALIGAMCAIYNETLFGIFKLEIANLILVKLILFVVSVIVLILFIAPRRTNRTHKKDKKVVSAKKETVKKTVKANDKNGVYVNKVLYLVLTFLFGGIGVHKFYAGKVKEGILRVLFCWTFIPTILAIAEFIVGLTEKADKHGKINVDSDKNKNVLFGTALVLFVLLVLGSVIPWEALFSKVSIFTTLNVFLSDLGVYNRVFGAFASGQAASGSINIYGTWTISDISILLFILTMVIALVSDNYNKKNFKLLPVILLVASMIATIVLLILNVNVASMILVAVTVIILIVNMIYLFDLGSFIEDINGGIKKVLPIALTAMLLSLVLVISVTTGINITMVNWIITLFKKFNIATGILGSIVGSFFTADFYYYVQTIGSTFSLVFAESDYTVVIAFIVQAIYYVVMFIAPTSVCLIIGLYYLNIPYNKWFKYIWKVLLTIFVLVIITTVILFLMA